MQTATAALHTATCNLLAARGVEAEVSVFLPFVRLSREVSSPDGQVSRIRECFRFDGDLVLLRGAGEAVSNFAAKINQARHEGLTVL